MVSHHNVIQDLLHNRHTGVRNALPIACTLVLNEHDGTHSFEVTNTA